MGNDYTARKQAHKARKQMGRDNKGGELKPKRERKKKNKIRSNCKGMCYSIPVITPDDKAWRGDEEAAASDAEVRSSLAAACSCHTLSAGVPASHTTCTFLLNCKASLI